MCEELRPLFEEYMLVNRKEKLVLLVLMLTCGMNVLMTKEGEKEIEVR